MRLIERYYWLICLAAIALGLVFPALGRPLLPLARFFLMAILFLTCLKVEWREVRAQLAKPMFVLYATVMMLVVLPAAMGFLARLVVPGFAVGVAILASMPAGMAGSSLTQIIGGNAALALVGTVVTTLAAPLTVPIMVRWLSGVGEGLEEGARLILAQTGWLTFVLFTPAVLAGLIRRLKPTWVEKNRQYFTGLSVIALGLLIFAIVAPNAEDTLEFIRSQPGKAVLLFAFTLFFSASLHLSAFGWAFWRPMGDRVALSVNAAYVNNGLALTFAMEFFRQRYGASAVLPAIAVEVPMVLGVMAMGWYARRVLSAERRPLRPEGASAGKGAGHRLRRRRWP